MSDKITNITKNGKKMGRPRIEIPKAEFEKLCELQCTKEEIAGFFGVSEDTIERWCKREYKATFAVVFKEKRGTGKISLRRSQFQMAQTNATMAIWLGKQYLGQKEPDTDAKIRLREKELELKERQIENNEW